MAHQFMLPTAAMLSLFGAGLGVHLGNGAIGEINPAYFSAEAPRSKFYADLTPNRPNWDSMQASELRSAASSLALGTGCASCRAYPEEYYPVHEASLGKADIGWAEVAEEPVAVHEAEAPDPEHEAVERYAHFAVSAEEQQALTMADARVTYASAEGPAAE